MVSSMPLRLRAIAILGCIGVVHLALLGFALIPAPYNILFMILNGLPLGMIWGLVFSFVEGRRLTELIGLGLSVSFIVSSGVVKSLGLWVMSAWGVSEFWMPFVVGCLALPVLGLSVWALAASPPPTAEEVAMSSARGPMNREDRTRMLGNIGTGMLILTLLYMLLSIYRDLRDTFMVDILTDLGYALKPVLLTQTELMVAGGVLAALGIVAAVRDHGRALVIYHVVFLASIVLVGASTLLLQAGLVSPIAWIVCTGLGVYGAYVPFNSILFDRVLSAFKYTGTAAFLIYVADAYGYLGSASLYVVSNLLGEQVRWVDVFLWCSVAIATVGPVLIVASLVYFSRKHRLARTAAAAVVPLLLLLSSAPNAVAHDGHDAKQRRLFEWILHPWYSLPGNAPGMTDMQTPMAPQSQTGFAPILLRGQAPTDHLQSIQSSILGSADAFTLELWTCNHMNTPVAMIAALRDSIGRAPVRLTLSNDTLGVTLGDSSTSIQLPRGFKRYWHHLALVRNKDQWTVFADGRQVHSVQQDVAIPSPLLDLYGYYPLEKGMTIRDHVKAARLYSRALDGHDVQHLLASMQGRVETGSMYETGLHFTAGPYLHYATTSSVNLTWEANQPADARIEVGKSITDLRAVEVPSMASEADAAGSRIMETTLDGLDANARYYYRMTIRAKDGTAVTTPMLTFQTAPPADQPVCFGVIGDTEARAHVNNLVAKQLWGERPQFIVNLGDLTDGGMADHKFEWNLEYFTGMSQLHMRVPVFPVPGNGEADLVWYRKYHCLPDDEDVYAFTYGPLEFFMLNSNLQTEFQPGGRQYEFLKGALARSKARWKVVCFHHAPYSADDDDFGNSWEGPTPTGDTLLRGIEPLMQAAKVNMVMYGHIHSYHRSYPINGITYVQSGGAGGNLEDFAPHRLPFTARTYRGHHYMVFYASMSEVEARVFDTEGRLRDFFTLK
jgi:hypothetical protein